MTQTHHFFDDHPEIKKALDQTYGQLQKQLDTPQQRAAYAQTQIFHRMFEPMPATWKSALPVGSLVVLIRPELTGLVPLLALGEITAHEDPESAMSEKGRPLNVKFDLSPYNMTLGDFLGPTHLTLPGINPEEPLLTTSTNLAPNDVLLIQLPTL